MATLTITNLGGGLTRRSDGDINSGLAKFDTSWGYDPYSKPGNLTWMEQPTSILSVGSVAGLITVMKQRTQSGNSFVYGVSDNSKLYQIQVTDSSNNNANLDSPSVLGAMAATVNQIRDVGMVFYGATEKIFYGDTGIQKINFDGSAGSILGITGSFVSAAPRPMTTFQGKIYFGNGNNIGEIDSTELITTEVKLSPSLPVGYIVRDLDVTPDGNYLQIIATRNNTNGGFTSLDSTDGAATESCKFLWNGTDLGVTSFETYSGIGLTANTTFGNKSYLLGYEQSGTALYSGSDKVVSLPKVNSPPPTATFSNGNMLGFMAPEYEISSGKQKGALFNYGQYDEETPTGLFRLLRHTAPTQTDVTFVPAVVGVSNLFYYPSYSSYTNNIAGSGKIYFSTIESSSTNSNTNLNRLWKFATVPTGVSSIVAGVYETQSQLFSKKVAVKEVRLYTDPLVANNAFTIDLIGSGGSVISGSSQNFAVGTNVIALDDLVRYNPASPPTYAVGVRITNASVTGTKNWTGTKLEIDYEPAGR